MRLYGLNVENRKLTLFVFAALMGLASAQTVELAVQIAAGALDGDPNLLTPFMGELFMEGAASGTNDEPFRFNPTTGMVTQITNANPPGGGADSNLTSQFVFDGNLYAVMESDTGRELFKYNTSTSQYARHVDLNGSGDGFPRSFQEFDGNLYFSAMDTNVGDELFRLLGSGGTAPEINVTGNGTSIADGDSTPTAGDNTDFGSALVAGGTIDKTFVINNTGTGVLSITLPVSISGSHASNFMVTSAPSASIAAGGNSSVTVRFDPSATGTRSAAISIGNSDSNENPYNFSIQGTGTAPEMDVSGNGTAISDGDTTPTAADNTDFGDALVAGETVDKVFVIDNSGSATLNLTLPVSVGGTIGAPLDIPQCMRTRRTLVRGGAVGGCRRALHGRCRGGRAYSGMIPKPCRVSRAALRTDGSGSSRLALSRASAWESSGRRS